MTREKEADPLASSYAVDPKDLKDINRGLKGGEDEAMEEVQERPLR
jgi:hypothetical protein